MLLLKIGSFKNKKYRIGVVYLSLEFPLAIWFSVTKKFNNIGEPSGF